MRSIPEAQVRAAHRCDAGCLLRCPSGKRVPCLCRAGTPQSERPGALYAPAHASAWPPALSSHLETAARMCLGLKTGTAMNDTHRTRTNTRTHCSRSRRWPTLGRTLESWRREESETENEMESHHPGSPALPPFKRKTNKRSTDSLVPE